jgi:alkylhydroperoxidase family enzyme
LALGDEELTRQALDDVESAPLPEKVRAALRFLRTLTLTPEQVTADYVQPLLAAGVSREGVADVAYVCYLFSIYTRLADSLGWALLDDAGYRASGRSLLKRGYL